MYGVDSPLTASQVLRTFHHDEAFLFLGSAFTTVGIVALALCAVRRRLDALTIYLGLFAMLYGQRLWLEAGLLPLMLPDTNLLSKLQDIATYLVPIPAFLFFEAAGFLGRRYKPISLALSGFFLCLVAGVLVFGPLRLFHRLNDGMVVIALLALAAESLRHRSPSRDFVVMRRGLFCFVITALWENIEGQRLIPFNLEPFGFALFLACLGYVAARRTLDRDQQLTELQKELDVARRIQLSILPGAFPESPCFRVAARYVPMTSVAGDFYDFVVTGGSQAGLLIADVSGHGVPAALIASMVKMAATAQRAHCADPARLLAEMNLALCGNTQSQFVTAAYAYLDAEAGELRYSAAGHPPMLLLREGKVGEVTENGLLLAAFTFASFSNQTLPLEPGDRLLLYTDGLLEAANAKGEFFGQEGLSSLLRQCSDLPVSEAADHILSKVQQWARAQDDDLTVLVCDYVGLPEPA